jgi:hypothetical protein
MESNERLKAGRRSGRLKYLSESLTATPYYNTLPIVNDFDHTFPSMASWLL